MLNKYNIDVIWITGYEHMKKLPLFLRCITRELTRKISKN